MEIRDLFQQMKTGIRNMITEVQNIFKSLYMFVLGLFSPREKEIEIPESWKNPGTEVIPVPVPSTPVAVEPSIVFKEAVKSRFIIRLPSWFLKAKQMLAFVLLVGSCISIVGLIFTFPLGLIFTIPTAVINLDYLIKTRPKTNMMRWYILPDLEEEK